MSDPQSRTGPYWLIEKANLPQLREVLQAAGY
jgi:hypothetical protein